MIEHGECECSEDYGPCETHSELLILRELAARGGDGLAACVILDIAGIWPDIVPADDAALAESVTGPWCETPEDSEALLDALTDAENRLPRNIWTDSSDGSTYRIVRVTGGPLYLED